MTDIENMVEIHRSRIISMGGTLYFSVPPIVKRQSGCQPGDTAVFYRSPDSDNLTLIIENKTEVPKLPSPPADKTKKEART